MVANAEENRDEDVAALRAAGIPVWVTAPATVDQALDLARPAVRRARPAGPGLAAARCATVWADPPQVPPATAVVPIWRRPWMVLGRDTFAGDVLARLGVRNVFADHADRYPKLAKDDPPRVDADLVVFPDEPYAFTPGRRAGGVAAVPAGVRQRPAPHLVRPVAGRGPGRC